VQGEGDLGLAAHLGLLLSIGVIIRTGVTTFHYVHCSFKDPWLISMENVEDEVATSHLLANGADKVSLRAWIKVDGSLNRRALDRFLGSILIVIMSWPGCTLANLANKITPALPPSHVHELVQVSNTNL
jgi:hypothetical protein